MAHAHRIGRTRAVFVYWLHTAKTYEMHMFHSARMKLGLDCAVLSHQRKNTEYDGSIDGAYNNNYKSKRERDMQAKDIDKLLKKGAYYMFWDDDDTEAQQFMETDLHQMIERCSRTITCGISGQSNISIGLGSFIKAGFVASIEDNYDQDVELDDPYFW